MPRSKRQHKSETEEESSCASDVDLKVTTKLMKLKRVTPKKNGEETLARRRPRRNKCRPALSDLYGETPHCGLCARQVTLEQRSDMCRCVECGLSFHGNCLRFSASKLVTVRQYRWECDGCKKCSSCKVVIGKDEAATCFECDRSFHFGCCNPAIPKKVPEGWLCRRCDVESWISYKEGEGERPRQRKEESKLWPQIPAVKKRKELKCPVEGCDSQGHLSGKFDRHYTITCCPVYHNLAQAECVEMARKQEALILQWEAALKDQQSTSGSAPTKKHPVGDKQIDTTCSYTGETEEDKKQRDNALELFGKSREPLLNGLVPSADIDMFRSAQMALSEKEQHDIQQSGLREGRVKLIKFGQFEMETWYAPKYPDNFNEVYKLDICEFCLKYVTSSKKLERHSTKCSSRHPPGNEIYRCGNLSFWEVDGVRSKIYCQNLCLLAKLFLDHKTLYWDVEPFYFYVLTQADKVGAHFVGYFSKEKSSAKNNVSCILTLPPYMRQGFGRLLIDFSYALSRLEGRFGTPETPLSDMGLLSYRSYWKDVVMRNLINCKSNQLSIKTVSQATSIRQEDLVSTLQYMGILKYWRGKHILLHNEQLMEEYKEKIRKRSNKQVDISAIKWSPHV